MLIANPIYDVVFKYLMDDKKVAKIILSAIIEREIVEIEFHKTEKIDDYNKFLTVFRLDFKAKIKEKSGEEKLVIIEIQKAKLPSDIMRFRKYLGEQYADGNNFTSVKEEIAEYKRALPIISIYFLGHTLEHTKAPVIKVQRNYIDVSLNQVIDKKEEFIESLTHDSYVIQIPYLKGNRRNDLEIILSVFDQENIFESLHNLKINEKQYPEKYQPIIRRLLKAYSEPKMRKHMDLEDMILTDIQNMERKIAKKEQILIEKEKTIEKKNKTIEENYKTIEEKNKKIVEKEKQIGEKDKAIEDQQRIIDELRNKLSEK